MNMYPYTVTFRGRLKKRGTADSAYNPVKLDELNTRRPYPFLYGMLSSLHYQNTGGYRQEALALYPKEIQNSVVHSIAEDPEKSHGWDRADYGNSSQSRSPTQSEVKVLPREIQSVTHMPPNVVMNSRDLPVAVKQLRASRSTDGGLATRNLNPYTTGRPNLISEGCHADTSSAAPAEAHLQGPEQDVYQQPTYSIYPPYIQNSEQTAPDWGTYQTGQCMYSSSQTVGSVASSPWQASRGGTPSAGTFHHGHAMQGHQAGTDCSGPPMTPWNASQIYEHCVGTDWS